MSAPECICSGNWRAIIEESEPLFERTFVNAEGDHCKFFGVLWACDDFYYAMWDAKQQKFHLLTCVGAIEQQGFKLLAASGQDV